MSRSGDSEKVLGKILRESHGFGRFWAEIGVFGNGRSQREIEIRSDRRRKGAVKGDNCATFLIMIGLLFLFGSPVVWAEAEAASGHAASSESSPDSTTRETSADGTKPLATSREVTRRTTRQQDPSAVDQGAMGQEEAEEAKRSATGLEPVVGVQPIAPIPQLPTQDAAPSDDKSLDPSFPANNLVATLPANSSVTIEYEVQVKAYNQWTGFPLTEVCDQHTVTDSSGLSVVTDDPAVGGMMDPTCVALDTADLSVSKTDSADPVNAGSALAYTVTVSNAGPAAAENVVVTDTLPSGVTFVSTSGCAEDPAGVPTCTLGSIGNGSSAMYTVNVTVDPDTTGSINNQVSVASAREAAPGNETASETTTIGVQSDLTLSKTDSVDPVNAGAALAYTVTVTNNGPSDASDVVVTDTLPAGVTFVSTSGCAEDPGGVPTCTLGTVSPGSPAMYTVNVTVDNSTNGTITNNASVTASSPLINTGDDSTSEDTEVNGEAALTLSKTDAPDPVFAGDQITYSLQVDNAGPGNAVDTTIFDLLPSGTSFSSDTLAACTQPGTLLGYGAALDQSAVGSGSPGTGQAAFFLDTNTDLLRFALDVDGMVNAITSATLRKASDDSLVHNLFATTPTFDNGNPISGFIQLTAMQSTDLQAEAHFVDVRSAAFPGGEIRGTLVMSTEGPVVCDLGTVNNGSNSAFDMIVDVDPSVADGAVLSNLALAFSSINDPNRVVLAPAGEISGGRARADTTVNTQADLEITKSDSADPVVAGSTLTYTVEVANLGPSDALDVVVTDTLPMGVTFVSTSGCTEDPNGVGTCTLGTVAADSSESFDITVTVDPGTSGTLTNNASVTSSTDLINTGDDSVSEDTSIAIESDLTITKTDSVDPVVAGNNLTYTVTVTNNGPSNVGGVVVTDTLPAGVTLVSTSGCAEDPSGAPTCTLGSIVAAGSAMYTVTVTVDSDATGTLTNNVSVAASTPLINTGDDSASETTTISQEADLTLTKVDDVDPVVAGNTLVYTLEVTNNGPSDAQDVVVTDTLPAGVTLVSTSGCAEDPNAVPTCTLGTLASGNSAQYTVTVTVDSDTTGTLTNDASVASSTSLINTGDDSVSEDTAVDTEADLVITKADDVDPVVAGNNLIYTLEVTNNGPSDALDVVVSDTLPAGVTFVSTSGCAEDPSGEPDCTLGTIAAGGSAQYTLEVTVDASTSAGQITNSASVASSTTLINTGDDSVSEDTTVEVESDLTISKTDSVDPVAAGDDLIYTIEVTNNGPSDAQDVVVTDTLPAGVTLVSTSGCAEDPSGAPDCTLGTISAGASVPYTLTVSVDSDASGSLTNNASVTASSPLINTGDDSTSEITAVIQEADLSITKVDDVDPVGAGQTLTYTVSVTNNGPSDASDVVVTDTLPAGVTLVSTSGCAEDPNGVPTCTLGSLVAGAAANVTVVVDVDPAISGTITNNASVASSTTDPDGANNATSEDTEVQPIADLAIVKSDSVDPVAGQTFSYSLDVTNNGPSTANGVEITDVLPSGLVFNSSPDGCTEAGGTVTCVIGTMTSGQMESRSFQVDLMAPFPPVVSNTAEVAGDEFDPDTDNNSDTEETTLDVIPPMVTHVNSVYDTGDGTLDECETVNLNWVQRLLVTFSESMFDPAGDSDADDVTNPANYQLVTAGADRSFQTSACGGAQGDDTVVGITAVSYDDGTFTADLTLALELPDDLYRLEVCGSTTLVDLAGNSLDGDGDGTGGDDFQRGFRVDNLNRFANGHFDCDLESWTATSTNPGEIIHADDDFEGSAESGSAQVENLTGSTSFQLDQCAPVVGDAAHRLRLALRLAADPGVSITLNRFCEIFDGTDCSGNSLGPVFAATEIFDSGGAFTPLDLAFTAPTGGVSALCGVTLSTGSGADFTANVDAMVLVTEGSIFGDGFESGDLSAWSAAVP